MSRIRANQFTDKAGTGAPTFPNGVQVTGVSTLGNTVVGGGTTQLVVTGNARITGILTIGTSSITLDGSSNQVNVGTGVTLHHTNGVQVGGNTLHSTVLTVNNINASGVVTATSFSGSGANLTGIAATTDVRTNSLVVSGVSTVAAGSSAAPSITPTGDTDTGIFFPSADTIAFAEGGSEAARIDSSGRLLVGTSATTSTALLQVQGNSSSSTGGAIIQLRRGTNNVGIINNTALGSIEFSNTESTISAVIAAEADANWNTTNDYPSRLVFSVTADGASSPTERMRIGNDGESSIFGQGSVLNCRTASTSSSADVLMMRNGASSTTTGTVRFSVKGDGDCENTNNSYGALSDIKLKENIADANSQWADIKALRVRKYNFKPETGHSTHTQIGLIAQELELVSPGLVGETPDRDEEGNDLGTVTKSVNYSVLYMKAVKALQEAMERIEQLEAEMAEVKAQLS